MHVCPWLCVDVAVPLKEWAYRSHPISVIASQRVLALIETCKLNDVAPFAYLTDVFTRIANGHPNSRIDQLLPCAFKRKDLKAVA